MKIGINASFLRKPATGIGQVTTHFVQTICAMKNRGALANVEVVLYVEEAVDFALPTGVSVRVCPPRLYTRDDLMRKIWWEKYTLPHIVHRDGCEKFLSLYQCPTVFHTKNVRHVMLVHDLIPIIFPAYLNNWRKKLYQTVSEKGIRAADHVVSVSEHTKQDLGRVLGLPEDDITTSHIAVDPLFLQEVSPKETARILNAYHLESGYIYTGGGMEMRKNVAGTLRAYARLVHDSAAKHRVPQLVISGKLMPELAPLVTDVENLVHELDIAEHVRILGFVPQKDLPALYTNALFFVFPSHYEGFGMPILEAMSVGTPVLTADNSSLREVGDNAVVYCDATSVQDIAHKMQKLVEDHDLRQHLSRAGKERALQFSWTTFTKNILAVLK